MQNMVYEVFIAEYQMIRRKPCTIQVHGTGAFLRFETKSQKQFFAKEHQLDHKSISPTVMSR
jgi:hypothetical protein